jgi:dihydrodipicolinate reductase
MRIIVGGSTGMVGTEIIRQALSHPDVSTVLALGRREISAPSDLGPNADVSKLKSVVLKDFENYTDDVKRQLQGADAVIWYELSIMLKSKPACPSFRPLIPDLESHLQKIG